MFIFLSDFWLSDYFCDLLQMYNMIYILLIHEISKTLHTHFQTLLHFSTHLPRLQPLDLVPSGSFFNFPIFDLNWYFLSKVLNGAVNNNALPIAQSAPVAIQTRRPQGPRASCD